MGCGPGSREHPHSVTEPSQPSFACRGLLFGRVVVRCNQPHPWFGCTAPSSPPAAVWGLAAEPPAPSEGQPRAAGWGSDRSSPRPEECRETAVQIYFGCLLL